MRGVRYLLIAATISCFLFGLSMPSLAAQQPVVLNVGVLGSENSPLVLGAMLVADKVNLEGGITLPTGEGRRLNIVPLAAEDSPTGLQAAQGEFAAQNVMAIIGTQNNTTFATLPNLSIPLFSLTTGNSVPAANGLYRAQALDNYRMAALVDVLVNEGGKSKIAVYQGSAAWADQAKAFGEELGRRGLQPVTTVLQVEGGPIEPAAQQVIGANPDVVVAFGDNDLVIQLITVILEGGYQGQFATTFADDPNFVRQLPLNNRGGIFGVTSWTPALPTTESMQFTADYVTTFGRAPTADSAVGYDAMTMIVLALRQAGADPAAFQAALKTVPAFYGQQGIIDPAYGNGELTRDVVVISTLPNGAASVIARFSKGQRVTTTAEPVQPQPTAGMPATPVPPVATIAPAVVPTLAPIYITATPDGVTLTVINDFINVRGGPGTNYNILGQLQKGNQVRVFGKNANATWFVINYNGEQAWISGDPTLVMIFGDVAILPVVTPPPPPVATPTPPSAPAGVQGIDLQLVSAVLTPATLAQNQPFTLTVTVRNAGNTNAGQFAVAASMLPGDKFGAAIIPGLAAGQQATVTINYPQGVGGGTGQFTVAVVLDLNNEVPETDENNNKPTITYTVQ